MSKKPSPSQQNVIDMLRRVQQPLERRPGGFWTYKGCLEETVGEGATFKFTGVPVWRVVNGIQSVRAMEVKGILRRTNVHLEEWRDERVLVES